MIYMHLRTLSRIPRPLKACSVLTLPNPSSASWNLARSTPVSLTCTMKFEVGRCLRCSLLRRTLDKTRLRLFSISTGA